jgi:hypothetical protein
MCLKEQGYGGVDFIHLARGWSPVAGFCAHGNEPSGPINVGGFLKLQNNYELLKDTAPWG